MMLLRCLLNIEWVPFASNIIQYALSFESIMAQFITFDTGYLDKNNNFVQCNSI